MNVALFICTLVSMVTLCCCGNNTVTDEAWFEVEIKGLDGPGVDYSGTFTIALFGDAAPITVLNFKSITKGYKLGQTMLHYKNSMVHGIVPDFLVKMGDITAGDGTGGRSIYGDKFANEEFILSHRSPGWVAMANHGPDTNGSQFYIVLSKARWLNEHNVVFGKVISGYNVVQTMAGVDIDKATGRPKNVIRIIDCGMHKLKKKYDLTEDQLDSVEDL